MAGIAYATWIGLQLRRWEIAIAVLAIAPWWLIFGAYFCWLVKSLWRGGHPVVLLVDERGLALALAMDDEGTLVRQFWLPRLRETKELLIVENLIHYMVARLPKDQLSSEHAELIRRCVSNAGKAGGRADV